VKLNEVSDWLQIIASVAVVAGLALVVQQLRQTERHTGADLIGSAYFALVDREMAILGEEPASALVRACMDPDSVTDEDQRVLAGIYNQRIYSISAMIEVEVAGGFSSDRWKVFAPSELLPVFETEHGRWYWSVAKASLWPELRRFGDELLADLGPVDCPAFWQSFRNLKPLPGPDTPKPAG